MAMRRSLRIARATLAGAAVLVLVLAAATRGEVVAPASASTAIAPAATAPARAEPGAATLPVTAPAAAAEADTALQFVRDGRVVSTLDLKALRKGCHERTVAIDDPYYGRRKSFRACPLAEVLQLGFGVQPEA